MSKNAIVPGSFDPITAGHVEIVRRAAALFDRVTVAILVNAEKTGTFTPEERLQIVNASVKELEKDGIVNVDARVFYGLTVDAARECGARYIVKGLRNVSDFDYEFQMDLVNKRINPQLETMFLTADQKYTFLSSSIVREMARYGADLHGLVPEELIDFIEEKARSQKG